MRRHILCLAGDFLIHPLEKLLDLERWPKTLILLTGTVGVGVIWRKFGTASTPSCALPKKGLKLSQLVNDRIRVANVLASTTRGLFHTRPATTGPIAFASCCGFVGRCVSAEGNPDLHNNTLHSCTVHSVESSEDELLWPLWNLLETGEVFWCVLCSLYRFRWSLPTMRTLMESSLLGNMLGCCT